MSGVIMIMQNMSDAYVASQPLSRSTLSPQRALDLLFGSQLLA